ncbi:MAG: hypothetical protein HOM03_14420 [Marinovum sp.]|nr:hypothetical protein [Marinovum sp.]
MPKNNITFDLKNFYHELEIHVLKYFAIPFYFLAACGSATDAVSTKLGTGAAQYTPAADLAASGKSTAQFNSDLIQCRNLGVQGQANQADKSGQRNITNIIGSTVGGAVEGYKEGDFFNNALGGGFDKKESAAIGAFSGLASGLTSALGSTNTVNNAGKETVDRCMRTRGYKVY